MSDTSTKAELLPEMVIELNDPIEWSGKSHTEVVLREPKAKEIKAALAALGSGNTPDAMVVYNTTLISGVSGLPRQVIEGMSIRQFNQAARYLERFLEEQP